MLTHVRHRRCHTLCTHASRSSVRCRCSYLFFYMFHKHNPRLGSKDKRRASKTRLLDKDKSRVYQRLPVPPNLFKSGKQLNGFFQNFALKGKFTSRLTSIKKKFSPMGDFFLSCNSLKTGACNEAALSTITTLPLEQHNHIPCAKKQCI